LIVYSSEGFDAGAVRAFEKATGIDAQLYTSTTSDLVKLVRGHKHSAWGVLWVDGTTALAPLDHQHLLLRNLAGGATWNSLGAHAVPKDKSYLPTGVTLAEALVYTSKVVTSPPTSWKQLLGPSWHGQVVMSNPDRSGSSYPFIAGVMSQLGGVSKGEKYFSSLKANGLSVVTTNDEGLQDVLDHAAKLALVQSNAAVGATIKNPTLRVAYLPKVTEMGTDIAVNAKASPKMKQEAKAFVKFILSATGQAELQKATLADASEYYPVVQGVNALSTVTPITAVKAEMIDPYVWGPRQSSIDAWFERHVAN
jgi:iron(III) transport system substrate-binding protein